VAANVGKASQMLTLGRRPAKPETVKKAYERIERSFPTDVGRARTGASDNANPLGYFY
jgi:hypothetical protein